MTREFEVTSERIIGAAIDVHRALGPGFLEEAYSRALRISLSRRGLTYHAQKEISLSYEGEPIGSYRLDLVVEGEIVVELKAVRGFQEVHLAQLQAYLRASGLHVGLLLNFNAKVLAVRRVVNGART